MEQQLNYEALYTSYIEDSMEIIRMCGLDKYLPKKKIIFKLNARLKSAIGRWSWENGQDTIEFSRQYFVEYANRKMHFEILNTIVHELCHAMKDGETHGTTWKRYADVINRKYNLKIKRIADYDEVIRYFDEIENQKKVVVQCEVCQREYRMKPTSVRYKKLHNYHCHCGGKLKKI